MILQMIYQFIILLLVIIIVRDVFTEKTRMMQLTAALVLIPFILRLLMIK